MQTMHFSGFATLKIYISKNSRARDTKLGPIKTNNNIVYNKTLNINVINTLYLQCLYK